MAALNGAFVDTSVLIAGTIDLGGPSVAAQKLMDAIASGRVTTVMTAWHCCLEFFSVTTRLPEEYRLSPADALTLLHGEILDRFEVVNLPARKRVAFLEDAVRDRVAGGKIYDAHIAEIARIAGAVVVVTENRRDFAPMLRYGTRVLTAFEAVEWAGLP